ncbi:MAG: hypothetical protein ACX93I_03645 [Winogradskyella sp.]
MESNKKHPKDFKVWTYSKFLDISHFPIIRNIKWLISLVFIEAAPKVPISLKRSFTGTSGKQAFFIGFVLALVFCLVINVTWTYFNGTLFPSESENPEMLYFYKDYWNLILYTLVCPTYVGLTCWLVVVVVKGWGDIKDFRDNETEIDNEVIEPRSKFGYLKAIFLGFLILSVAFALTTNYINDIEKLANNTEKVFESTGDLVNSKVKYYWFFTEDDNGNYKLGSLGVYYFLLNYSLLMITLIALTFFMSIYKIMMGVGKALETKQTIGKLDFMTLKTKLAAFTEAYILAKGLVVVYIINIIIWIQSPLGENATDQNIQVAVILMGIIGVFMVSIPRYYVELQWYRLKNKSNLENTANLDYEDLRPFWMNYVATVCDSLFIGGFILSYGKYAFG